MLRSRDIAKKLTLNKAIVFEPIGKRNITLPTGSLSRQRRFGNGPGILSGCLKAWQSGSRGGEKSSGWLFLA